MTYRVTAYNSATASANKIHDDAVARQYGFGGGLVPGVTIFAYMTHPAVEKFGLDFLKHGRMSAKFLKPIYDGDEIEVRLGDDLQLEVRNPSGIVCAAGSVAIGSSDRIDLASHPAAELPDPVPAASEEAFADREVLGVVRGEFTTESASSFLDLIQDDLHLYRDERVAHPGWLITWANLALVSNFRLGPWIHTSSDVMFVSLLLEGEPLEVRGRVKETYERRGHKFVDLDVILFSDDRPVMRADHTAIYEPRLPEVTAS